MRKTLLILAALALAAGAAAGVGPFTAGFEGEIGARLFGVDGGGPWCALVLKEAGVPGPAVVFRGRLYERCAAEVPGRARVGFVVRAVPGAVGAAPLNELAGVKLTYPPSTR